MDNPLSYLNALPSNKAEIKSFANAIIEQVPDYGALKIAAQLKALELLIKTIKDNDEYKKELSNDIDLEMGEANMENATIKRSYRNYYSFKDNDIWKEANKSVESYTNARKEIENKISIACKKSETYIVESTGEVFEPVPFKGKEIISVSIK